MESLATYTRQLQALLNRSLDIEEEIKRLVDSIDFTTEDWRYMYDNHRLLAHELSALHFKYGSE